MPSPDGELEGMKKWRKAKQKIGKGYDMYQWLIMMSATSGRDHAFLVDQDPLFIVRNFIGQSLNG